MRRAAMLALATLALGATTAGAASVVVASGLLATASKTLTKATCTLQPTSGDTYVNEFSKTTGYASNSSLTTESTAGSRKRVFLRFNLDSCATTIANAAVDSATLNLNVSAAAGGTRTLKVYRVTSTWTASSLNWNGQPTAAADHTTTFTAAASSTGQKAIDVTMDVNDYVQSAPNVPLPYTSAVANHGWMILDDGASTGVVAMTSSEGPAANRPKLTIVYAY
jgi:hypothetical protein